MNLYQTENIDTKKALDHIAETRKRYQTEQIKEQEKIQKYYEGLQKGLDIAEDMFHCITFEKSEKNDGGGSK